MKRTPAIVTIIVALIVVAVIGWFLYHSHTASPYSFSSEKVTQTAVDLRTATSTNRLPAGFPKDIPVDYEAITSAETLVYPDKGQTLYSVTYTSTKSPDRAYADYHGYLLSTRWLITGGSTSTPEYLQAASPEGRLTVTITPVASSSSVTLALLAPKK